MAKSFPRTNTNASSVGSSPRATVIYTRVSTDDQAREGCSLAAQKEACDLLCRLRQLPGTLPVEDAGYSAKSLNRPGIQQVLRDIRAGQIGAVVVWRLDRLTRRLRDLLDLVDLCDQHSVALVSVTEQLDTSTPMGRLMLAVLGAIAQWERESIGERVTLGRRHRQAAGGWMGGHVPAACQVEGGVGDRVLRPHPIHGPIASHAWHRIISGESLAEVATWLTAQGIPAPWAKGVTTTRAWNKQNVDSWLSLPVIIGVLTDRATWEACRATLSARSSPKRHEGAAIKRGKSSDRLWILQGLARCGVCGSMLVGSAAYGRGGKAHYYLRCTNRIKAKGCTVSELPAIPWEQAVIRTLIDSAHGKGDLLAALNSNLRTQQDQHAPALARQQAMQAERDLLQVRMDRLLELVASGDAVSRAVGPKLGALQMDIERQDRALALITAEIAASTMDAGQAGVLLGVLRARLLTLDQEPPEVQRAILRATVKEVRLSLTDGITMEVWPLGQNPHPDGPNGGFVPSNDDEAPTGLSSDAAAVGSDSGRPWRRERDSNPRDPFGPFGFQDRRNRPLCHLS